MQILEPECRKRGCRHYQGIRNPSGAYGDLVPCCVAFPDGIPAQISNGLNPHTEPVDGDHGVQFELLAPGEDFADAPWKHEWVRMAEPNEKIDTT